MPGQEGYADLRPFFPGTDYIGADMRAGPGVDVVLDLHEIDLPPGSVGTALILETLEHVESPWKAIAGIHRILRNDGIVIASSQMNYPIHNHPMDYWRFTPEAFKVLLRPFADSYVEWAGQSQFPHTVVGVGFKEAISKELLAKFRRGCDLWKDRARYPEETLLGKLITLVTPPIASEASSKIRAPDP